MMTRRQQRAREWADLQIAFNLELRLRSLISQIMAGDRDAMVDFQQTIQYAPTEMRDRIHDLIERLSRSSGIRPGVVP